MSFLSPPQQYLLAVLNETRCLRKRQATALLHRKFGVSQTVVNAIIRQLRAIGRIREYEDTISLVGPSYSEAMLQAVDLVLAVFPLEAPQLIHAQPPFVLAAFIEKRDILFQVMHIPMEKEVECCLKADDLSQSQSEVHVLLALLLDCAEQRSCLHLRKSCLLAYPDGEHKLKIEKLQGGERDGIR